jgi:transglutaminase-like putative cysteine protease
MAVSRREFLMGAAAIAAMPAFSRFTAAQGATAPVVFAPSPGAWRKFEIKTVVEIAEPKGAAQAWIPVPSFKDEAWAIPGETRWTSPSGTVERVSDANSGAEMLHVSWASKETAPTIEVVSTFSGRDRSVEIVKTAAAPMLAPDVRLRCTSATELLPLDGIVRETSLQITSGAGTDLEKAQLIYAWIIENTFRDPKVRGCGVGDIASMLMMGNLGGKCADLNALYVGLARAAGVPARDLYGIRVAPSAFGYKSLGANSPTITKAQHCRAEVFVEGIGWVPADPADVRKVVLEEPPGNLDMTDPHVTAARDTLFGAWETNWLAYNDAHDVTLPGSDGPTLPFLMYPQAETTAGRLDPLDPDNFKYTITAREVEA